MWGSHYKNIQNVERYLNIYNTYTKIFCCVYSGCVPGQKLHASEDPPFQNHKDWVLCRPGNLRRVMLKRRGPSIYILNMSSSNTRWQKYHWNLKKNDQIVPLPSLPFQQVDTPRAGKDRGSLSFLHNFTIV